MKVKFINSIIVITSLFISVVSYGQLKVDQLGRIGMGTNWPNSGYKCHIKGDLLLTNFPTTPTYEMRLKVDNGWPGVEMGSTSDRIAFWSSGLSFNKLYAESYLQASDKRLKSKIQPIENSLSAIMKLNAYSYVFNDNDSSKSLETNKKYGFLSQEVEELFPDVNITEDIKGVKLMDYNQITPLLLAATKEQQFIIDSLEDKLNILEEKFDLLNSNNGNTLNIDKKLNSSKNVLYQNRPNPFNKETIIKYDILEENFDSGSILIFDMKGTLLNSYVISSGKNELTINSEELKAGMYMYTLIVNNKELDTKRMILVD